MNERDILFKEYTDRSKPKTRKFEDFLAFETFKNKFENRLKDTESKIGGLFTSEWIEPFFEKFISNSKIASKTVENFFQFFQDSTKGHKHITFSVFESEFARYIHMYYFPKIIDEFLNSQHSFPLNYNGFSHHILIDHLSLFNFIKEDDLKPIFDKQKKERMEKSNKNQFGLDAKDVDHHLETIFNHNSIGDGSFLYAWSSSESNGIEKYNTAAANDLYKEIEPTEKLLYKFLLSEDSSQKLITSRETKLLKTIGNAKSFVELGPGGVNKLAEYLNYYPAHFGFANFLKNKKIYLVDVNADGYKGVKQDLNKIAKSQITEGIEANFFDKDSSGYKASKPCYFMFGGTIGNFSLEQINILLDSMKSKEVRSSTGAVITYFSAPDKNKLDPETYQQEINKIKAMYGDDQNNPFFNESARESMSDLVLSGFTALGLDISKLEYAVEYEESTQQNPSRIKLGAKLKEDISIKTSDGQTLSKRAGEYIRAVPSARFTDTEFKKLAEQRNFDIIIQQAHNGVAVAALKSKTALNDKYKKIRNIGYSLAIAAALAGGYIGYHSYEKNKIANERIENHEKKLFSGRGMHIGFHLYELDQKSHRLASQFIKIYGSGSLSELEIKDEIRLYLEKFSNGQYRYNEMSSNSYKELEFLQYFVDNYFYKKMFKNGFDSIDPIPVLKSFSAELIETLKYEGPLREGYDKKTGTYSLIYNPLAVTTKNLSTVNDGDLVSGYILPHTGKVVTFQCPISRINYIRSLSDGVSNIILSVSEPDTNGYCKIDRFVFDETSESIATRVLKEGKRIVFLNTHEPNNIGESKNLLIEKDKIIDLFEKEDPKFQHCRDVFIHSDAIDPHKLNERVLIELKRLMIIDLYTKNDFGGHPLGDVNVSIASATPYVLLFIENFTKTHENIVKTIIHPDGKFSRYIPTQ